MGEPNQPHDKLFKALTDDPRVAGIFLRERSPSDIVALLSDEPPEAIDGGFIDPELATSQSDRLLRLRAWLDRVLEAATLDGVFEDNRAR